MSKPFSLAVLKARIRKILQSAQQGSRLISGRIVIDRDACRVTRKGGEIPLSRIEYQLLLYLVENRNRVLAKEQILSHVWGKIALDVYYQMERKEGESPLEFCIRMGWADYIYEMLAVDFLILSRDRHGANIEVLRDRRNKTIRLAPLFDHGLSFFFSSRSMADIKMTRFLRAESSRICFIMKCRGCFLSKF